MTHHKFAHRIISAAALVGLAGLLAIGAAACGKSEKKAAPATSPSPAVSASPAVTRADACARIDDAETKLIGPLMDLSAAGSDPVRIKIAVEKLKDGLDAFAVELIKLRDETASDKDLNDALGVTITDVVRINRAIDEANYNRQKIESILQADSGSDPLDKLCAG